MVCYIYKERKENELREERNKKLDSYEDPYTKLNDEFNKKLLEQLKKDNMESSYETYERTTKIKTDKRRDEESKINEEYNIKREKLSKFVDEVEAQLKLCTTREECLEVLKLYKIVDKSGKIYGCVE